MMAASMDQVISHQSSIGTVQLTPTSRVKVEKGEELITILSNTQLGTRPL
jgi:hypothetical protein